MVQLIRWSELVEQGLTRSRIDAALAAGELRRLRRGVYVVVDPTDARPPRVPESWLGELHAAGPDARLAGPAAARHLHLDGFDDAPAGLLIEVPARSARRGAHIRRVTRPGPLHLVAGVPLAPVERILLGLGADLQARPGCRASRHVLPAADLVELAIECAVRRRLTTVADLVAAVEAAGRRTPGRTVLAHVLARRPAGAPATESYLETRLVQVLRDAGLADPER